MPGTESGTTAPQSWKQALEKRRCLDPNPNPNPNPNSNPNPNPNPNPRSCPDLDSWKQFVQYYLDKLDVPCLEPNTLVIGEPPPPTPQLLLFFDL
jgi:hypothetical protein